AAGVTGSGFIVLAATLSSVGTIPVASIALILGVDRFMSEARALTNLIGNGVATVVVAKWENALDEKRMRRVLDNETEAEAGARAPPAGPAAPAALRGRGGKEPTPPHPGVWGSVPFAFSFVAPARPGEPNWPDSLTIGTASPGGTYHVYGAGLAQILTRELGL